MVILKGMCNAMPATQAHTNPDRSVCCIEMWLLSHWTSLARFDPQSFARLMKARQCTCLSPVYICSRQQTPCVSCHNIHWLNSAARILDASHQITCFQRLSYSLYCSHKPCTISCTRLALTHMPCTSSQAYVPLPVWHLPTSKR